ncbi:hypothetical protein FACS1894139_12880 [Planctomycetales bacterium]|nr:hypothetical protein FACS1894107_05920 [Planctomycetales bacterium]GHT00824.1 hypothetical protein FACS1894108_13810 [Planctomycetales bacterium]GHT06618.1 hypothetical protein FACS1894139_12880 [Planctomycetales bacterium]
MKKFLVNLLCAFIRDKHQRRAVQDVLLNGVAPAPLPVVDDFMYACGVLSCGEDKILQDYFLNNNMPAKITQLKMALDEESKQNIDRYLQKMLVLPDGKISINYKISRSFLEKLQTQTEKEFTQKFFNELPSYKLDVVLNRDEYNPDTFLFHHGLRFLPQKVKDYIAGKDFIDGGAYIGDSAIMLNKYYNPRKVWSFEISENNTKLYYENLQANDIQDDKCALIPMGLWSSSKNIFIKDVGGQGASILQTGESKITLTDVDSFVDKNNLNVGFIKSDVEGVGLAALNGMVKTIRKQRPVLSLAIYHNPTEFFEMCPRLQECAGEEYKITVTQFHPFYDCNNEIAILAYPKELDNE